jgi:hypothetical protein
MKYISALSLLLLLACGEEVTKEDTLGSPVGVDKITANSDEHNAAKKLCTTLDSYKQKNANSDFFYLNRDSKFAFLVKKKACGLLEEQLGLFQYTINGSDYNFKLASDTSTEYFEADILTASSFKLETFCDRVETTETGSYENVVKVNDRMAHKYETSLTSSGQAATLIVRRAYEDKVDEIQTFSIQLDSSDAWKKGLVIFRKIEKSFSGDCGDQYYSSTFQQRY